MVWDGGSEPLVVPTRWDFLGVALGGPLVWMCGAGVVFADWSVVRCICVTYEEGWMFS